MSKEIYILFKRKFVKQPAKRVVTTPYEELALVEVPPDVLEHFGEKPEELKSLSYICESRDPKEIHSYIMKSPLDKYVLFRGTLTDVTVSTFAFIDGKSLATLDEEWGEAQED